MALGMMSKKISYIGHVNTICWPDEPETTFGATARIDKPGPSHQLKDLGGLCRWQAGRGRDLMSLKRFGRIRQTTEGLERLINAWRDIGAKHDSYLSDLIVRNEWNLRRDGCHRTPYRASQQVWKGKLDLKPVRNTGLWSVVLPKTMAGEMQHDDDQHKHTNHGVEDLDS